MHTKELTAHHLMAQTCGTHPNTLAMFQRQKVVPRDVEMFREDDVVLVQKLTAVMQDPDLIRLQIGKKPKRERDQLFADAKDFKQYKQWERKVIWLFVLHGEKMTKAKAMSYAKFRFGKEPSAGLKARIGVFKWVAAGRPAVKAKTKGDVSECEPV